MSAEEINEVITRAERMREVDEKEAKRVKAYSDLETYCIEVKFQLSGQLTTDHYSQAVVEEAQECLDWLKVNREASEAVYTEKLRQMKKENEIFAENPTFGARKQSYEQCYQMGERSLRSSDLHTAYEWFYKAYKLAGKHQSEKLTQTALRLAQICREFAQEPMNNYFVPEKIIKYIYRGASHLLIVMKYNTFEGDLLEELARITDLFYDKVPRHGKH